MDKYLIWGGGGHGKVVADVARSAGMSVHGFIDADASKLDSIVEPGGARVAFIQENFLAIVSRGSLPEGIAGVLLAVGSNRDRAKCRAGISADMLSSAIHASATVAKSVNVGPGTVIMAGAVVNSDTVLGAGVIVNSGAIIEHDCQIGDDSHIAPGSVVTGGVRIGKRVLVGAGSVIIPGITIGDDAVIGAGSVVIGNIDPNARVAGNPATAIRS